MKAAKRRSARRRTAQRDPTWIGLGEAYRLILPIERSATLVTKKLREALQQGRVRYRAEYHYAPEDIADRELQEIFWSKAHIRFDEDAAFFDRGILGPPIAFYKIDLALDDLLELWPELHVPASPANRGPEPQIDPAVQAKVMYELYHWMHRQQPLPPVKNSVEFVLKRLKDAGAKAPKDETIKRHIVYPIRQRVKKNRQVNF